MKEEQNKSKKHTILIVIIAVLILLMGGAIFYIYNQQTELEELYQDNEITKQQLEDEYEGIALQYEGFKINIKNDSLLEKLTSEQLKVQSLLDELKTVKANNRQEINRLNKELSTLRKILKSYVNQIDSLNRANEKLRTENTEIKNKYTQTQNTLREVSRQKENLSKTVSLASKLDAVAISVVGINKKGKAQKKIKSMEQLVINFTIAKNITAEPGTKDIYLRIMKPDSDILIKNRNNTFAFEDGNINYSVKRTIEYEGEEIPVTLYWDIEEFLQPGTYRVDIFADGNLIGKKSFELSN